MTHQYRFTVTFETDDYEDFERAHSMMGTLQELVDEPCTLSINENNPEPEAPISQYEEHLRDSAPDNSRFDGFDRGDLDQRDDQPIPPTSLNRYDPDTWLKVIWNALHNYRDAWDADFDRDRFGDAEEWDDICTAMAWIKEELMVAQKLRWPLREEQTNEKKT